MILYEKNIDSSFQAVHETVLEILEILKKKWPKLNKNIVFKINFLLRELMNNAVEHGNKFSQDKKVLCRIIKEHHYLILEVTDEGNGIVLTNQTFDTDDTDVLLRDRNRGYQLLIEMAQNVTISGSQVKAIIDLKQED